MAQWRLQQLTRGTNQGIYHSHSYYDIDVFDSCSRRLVAYQVRFAERKPTSKDELVIGIIDLEDEASWETVGTSFAWSGQQGAMAQWLPRQTTVIWNDRDHDTFVTRMYNLDTGRKSTLPRPSYAVDPNGRFTLSLNMTRLDTLRPGYGYVDGKEAQLGERRPTTDGVWRQNINTGKADLILSLNTAVRFLHSRLGPRDKARHWFKRFYYWFNHVKISPDGKRFTVKLRFKELDKNWNNLFGCKYYL